MIQYLMQVPTTLLSSVTRGSALVDGAMVRSARTGKILAHLQQSRRLADALASGPVGAVSAAVQAASSVAANVQLEQIKGMLSTLQLVAGVGAAASILNLGVSVGGFALVLSRLKKLEKRLETLDAKVDDLRAFVEDAEFAKVKTAIERCEHAHLRGASDRVRVLQDGEKQLHEATELAFMRLHKLAGRDEEGRLKLYDTELDANQIAERVAVPMMYVQVRLEALLLLGSPDEGLRLTEQLKQWLGTLDVRPLEYVKKRRQGIALGPHEINLALSEARGLDAVLQKASQQARDRVALCEAIVAKGIDSAHFVDEVRNHPEPTVLMLQVGDEEA
ncbi:MAG: hypothetical protein JO257_15720 [Deltaproteobacteria bacterium]|nr:hypothetical protein [Deltaproteobacteria bacterium]